ncbi:MAG: hypothetical protein E7099_08855 [Mediterranea massiliensis]|nr:hypothetical protein [Mediterranea massiliensis]
MKDKAYWLALAQRYFEAETTLAEEAALKQFLATAEAEGSEFDELRAVMGYLSVGRKLHRQPLAKAKNHRPIWWAAAAIVTLLLLLPPIQGLWDEKNVCVAYVGGQKVSDTNKVMALMHQTLQGMKVEEPDMTMQGQLQDIFNTLE